VPTIAVKNGQWPFVLITNYKSGATAGFAISFCRTLPTISSESRGSWTARASTMPPSIAAAGKMASFRSPRSAERISSSPCSNAALSSGVERKLREKQNYVARQSNTESLWD